MHSLRGTPAGPRMASVTLSIAVFVLVYLTITFELVNKAVAALLGVMILVILRVVDEHHAVGFIDFETILLLLGMMIIVAILRRSGVFSLLTVKIAEMTRGNPLKILVLFSVVTAVLSAFLGAFAGARLLEKVTLRLVQVWVAILLFVIAIGLGAGIV